MLSRELPGFVWLHNADAPNKNLILMCNR